MFGEPETDEEKEIASIEKLIFDVQYEISKSMYQTNVSKAELARRLGCSSARVSQWLGDSGANLTLKTIARIFHALQDECSFHSLIVSRNEQRQKSEEFLGVAKSYEMKSIEKSWTQGEIHEDNTRRNEKNLTGQLTSFLWISNDNDAGQQDKQSNRRSWKQAA